VKGYGFAHASLPIKQLKTSWLDKATDAMGLEGTLAQFGKELVLSKCKFNFDAILMDMTTALTSLSYGEYWCCPLWHHPFH
jgi:hypothetical protein